MAFMIPAVGAPQTVGGGGGSDLPPVTAEDNGDVLTVVNGAWDKAAPSGGGGALAVHIEKTVISADETNYTTDKTAGEIKAALEAGQIVTIPYTSVDPFTGATMYNIAIMGGIGIEGASAVTFDYKDGDGFSAFVDASIANSTDAITMLAATESDYLEASEGGK